MHGGCCLVAKSYPTLCNHMVAHQAPLSMGFSRQESWSELPFPSPGDLPNPGIKTCLPGGFFTTEPPGKSHAWGIHINNLLGFLLLSCPSLLGSQPRTQKCRQKTIFTPLHYENLATGQDRTPAGCTRQVVCVPIWPPLCFLCVVTKCFLQSLQRHWPPYSPTSFLIAFYMLFKKIL